METNKENYHFASQGLEEYLSEISQKKQQIAVDNSEDLSFFDKMNSVEKEKEAEKQVTQIEKVTKPMAQSISKSAAGVLEVISKVGNGLICDLPENSLSDGEREYLEDSFEAYFIAYGIKDLPPSWLLVICICVIFAPKTFNAVKCRKEKKQIELQRSEIDKLRAKLEMYETKEKQEKSE